MALQILIVDDDTGEEEDLGLAVSDFPGFNVRDEAHVESLRSVIERFLDRWYSSAQ